MCSGIEVPVPTENPVRHWTGCMLPNHDMIRRQAVPDQTAVRMAGIIPEVATAAAGGEHCAPSPTKHPASAGGRALATFQFGSSGVCLAVSLVPHRRGCRCDHPTGNAGPVASARIQGILALEVTFQSWPPYGLGRDPRVDPGNEPSQLLVGRAAYPWRTAQARYRDCPIDGRQIHDQASRKAWPELDNLPAQPRGRDCSGGSLRRAHDWLQVALWVGHPGSWPAEADSSCGDGASNCRVGCSTDCRGVSLGLGAPISRAGSRCRLW